MFDPARGIVYVATGRPPVCNRPYVAFDLAGALRAARSRRPSSAAREIANVAAIGAFDAYRDAFEAHFNKADVARRAKNVARARELQPRQAHLRVRRGPARARGERRARGARAFDAALALGHDDAERIASFRLWRGRALDALGRRDEALVEYARREDGRPERAPRRREERERSRYKLRAPAIEWSFGDVISP